MARILASPFGLPHPSRPGSPAVLAAPQYLTILAGAVFVPLCLLLLLYPWILDAIGQREMFRHRAAFGYAVGDVPTKHGLAYWGVTAITPGGRAERAGLRRADVLFGTSGSLFWAVKEASAGRRACLDVWNVDDPLPPRDAVRTVCFEGGAR
jgi:hypothetical protein